MGVALRSMAKGASLTDAAYEGGFGSSAHFSSAFREMFGMEPSRLARLGMTRTALPGAPLSA
jgi:methylphosphotriester-DNA--protein-cysteine methyltransferase